MKGVQTKVLRLALPAASKHLLDILQILIDMIMVGMINVYALAGVGLSMQFMMAINALMTLYIVGGNAVIARFIGQNRKYRASGLFYSLFIFALVLSLPVSLFGFWYSQSLFIWMGASHEVVVMGAAYFTPLVVGISFVFIDALFFNALSAAGDTSSSFYIKIVSAVVNVLFNYLLIFGHGGFDAMGVAGAAYATLIAYGINIVLYMMILRSKNSVLIGFFRFDVVDLIRALKVGYSAMLDRSISVFSFILFVGIITAYGTEAIAGYQVGLRIEGLAFMPGFGFAVAAMAMVGQNLGALRLEEAYRSGIESMKLAIVLMGSVGLLLLFFPEFFISFFTQDSRVIQSASIYLQLVGISQIPLAMTFVLSGALRGAGATKTTLKINVLSLWILRVIPSYIAYKLGLGLLWIYIIMTIETYIKGGVYWYIYGQKRWQKIKI
ncbi:MAG TPA: MATE family efflux transporter [Helicobacteraceae bacterium]|nr:MATE family efflux transporter [Helicobacteraceae bacterium]